MKRVAMISNELAPYRCDGGLGVAVERLCLQLSASKTETTVFFPSKQQYPRHADHSSLLTPIAIPISTGPFDTEKQFAAAATDFCWAASERITPDEFDCVVAHDNESAFSTVLSAKVAIPTVFWLHSLYDHPRKSDLPTHASTLLQSPSLVASAVASADVVVASSGLLHDARQISWPKRLGDLQTSLLSAADTGKMLLAESLGCLPDAGQISTAASSATSVVAEGRPYVLFAGRPVISKGIGFYQAIAERMSGCGIDFVAVGQPSDEILCNCRNIRWIPWLPQIELFGLMTRAAAVVHPSITEGYGLAAAESCLLNENVLCHEVGGLRALTERGLAQGIALTDDELISLYELWAKLLSMENGEYWKLWQRYLPRFRRLTSQWAQRLRDVTAPTNRPVTARQRVGGEKTWGQTLMERL